TLDALRWGDLAAGTKLAMEDALFPRRDMPEKPEAPASAEPAPAPAKKPAAKKEAAPADGAIAFDDFLKVELRVGTVIAAEAIEGADKLLRLQVDLGTERRQIVAGIAKHFAPDALVG